MNPELLCVHVTFHLHHINRNLFLSHAEDFKVSDHPLEEMKNSISNVLGFLFTSQMFIFLSLCTCVPLGVLSTFTHR